MSRALLALVAAAGAMSPAVAQRAPADSAPPAISTMLTYTSELVGNVTGGVRRGGAIVGVAGAQAQLLLGRLVGWRGARVYVLVLGTHGGAPSDLVGDGQGVSNLEAPDGVRVEEAWLQQNAFGNRASWLVGRYDLNAEFYRLQSAALFSNSSFGIGPELAQSGVAGPSIFPSTAVGGRFAFKPSPNVVWRVAVLDGVPVDRPSGGTKIFASGDGALVVGELALLSRPDTAGMTRHPRFQIGRGPVRPYRAKVALGGWYYTTRLPDLAATLPSGAAVVHRGSGGAYLIADRTLWSAAHGSPTTLTAFAQLGLGDERVEPIGRYAGGGVTLAAPFPSRALDAAGLAVAAAFTGSHAARAQRAAGIATTAAETTLELTYLAQVAPWLAVQGDVQYVIHPGAVRARRNALVPGLRLALMR